ncbi:MAG: hypothetical protein KAQ79_10130 [Cyclobacteriaceae bacterium]|nr:hypothetical protein [Cyclobacteriaceae bacterium]
MEKIDLKALARELKQTASNEETLPVVQAAKKSEVKKKVIPPKKDAKSELTSIITTANQRSDFELGHAVYIDSEIHDILRQVKSQTRLVVGNLVSSLLEEFILEHKSEIILLFKRKTNRLI